MKKIFNSGVIGLSLVSTAAFAQVRLGGSDPAGHRLNINIPTNLMTVEQAQQLLDFFSSSITEGKKEIVLADELAKVDVPAEYKSLVDKIVASRDPSASVECTDRKCKIESAGKALDFKIDGVSIPVLGTPSVSLGKKLEIYTRVSEDGQRAEVCKIVGIAVKVGFLKPAVEGALIEMEDGKMKNFLVDASGGGSYPSNDCDFLPGSSHPTEPTTPTEPAQPTEPTTEEPTTTEPTVPAQPSEPSNSEVPTNNTSTSPSN
ncbi:MAG: hypothetical protein H7318_19260 [Oligoflexus sp.]|nr:hypothetical protein [Oligoflexus sp.]